MIGEQLRTGTRDEHYDLISVLHHLLQGTATLEQYIRDAQEAGDQELVQFFHDLRDEQRHLAERAKNLLVGRFHRISPSERAVTNASVRSGGTPRDDIVDEQSKESFPASDAPSTY